MNVTKKWLDRLCQKVLHGSSGAREFWYDVQDKHYWIEVVPPKRLNHVVRWGKDLRRKIGQFPAMSVEEARRKVREYVVKLDAGENPFSDSQERMPVAKVTLRDAIEQYLEALEAGQRKGRRPAQPRTVRNVRQIFLGLADEPARYACFRSYLDRNLWRLNADDVVELHAAVQDEAKTRSGNNGMRCADEAMQMLRAAINVQRLRYPAGKRPHNAVDVLTERHLWQLGSEQGERSEPDPLTDAELVRLVHVLNDWPRDRNLVHRRACQIQLLTGFRRERAMKLRWDMDKRDYLLISVSQNAKSKRTFRFPITTQLRTVLDACREFGNPVWVTPGTKFKQGDYEGPLNSDTWWRDAFQLAGIDGSSHRIRRTVGTKLAVLKGGQAASWLLGHAVAGAQAVTSDSYINVDPLGDAREWLASWHDFLVKKGLRLD